jgi:protein-tyrosine-phosphatase
VHQLTLGMPVTTQSYGTLSVEDAPALNEAVEIASRCGISLGDHRSRFLNKASLGDADLVLGFEPAHVRQAVVDAGAQRKRTFLMDEFVSRLPPAAPARGGNDMVERARELVAAVTEPESETGAEHGRGMPDPFGMSWQVYRGTALEIRELSIALVERLFAVAPDVLPPIPTRIGRRRYKPLRRY